MKAASGPDVFLLGAGFARAISSDMPLLQDLASRVANQRALRAKIPREVTATMHDNFAHALSYLEQPNPARRSSTCAGSFAWDIRFPRAT